jgi:hypothetical protein
MIYKENISWLPCLSHLISSEDGQACGVQAGNNGVKVNI